MRIDHHSYVDICVYTFVCIGVFNYMWVYYSMFTYAYYKLYVPFRLYIITRDTCIVRGYGRKSVQYINCVCVEKNVHTHVHLRNYKTRARACPTC